MAGEKYIPKVGDKVAIVGWRHIGGDDATPAIVTKACKRYVMVGERRFNLPDLRAPRAAGRSDWGSIPDHIEPWTRKHADAISRANACRHLWSAIDTMRVTGAAREQIEALPIARLEGAAELLRALMAEAKAVKQ